MNSNKQAFLASHLFLQLFAWSIQNCFLHPCYAFTIRFWVMQIECAFNPNHVWRWIGTEPKPNLSFIHRITIKLRSYAPMNSSIVEAFVSRPPYMLYSPSNQLQWPVMLGHSWLGAAENETAYQVGSCSSSKFTFHIVYYEWQGKANNWTYCTLVCVSIHLECWLGKARVEIVTWAAVIVASQQQFSYNSVIKLGSVNAIDVDSICIQCTSGECEFNSHSNRIQCEKALKLFLLFPTGRFSFFSTNQTTLEAFS